MNTLVTLLQVNFFQKSEYPLFCKHSGPFLIIFFVVVETFQEKSSKEKKRERVSTHHFIDKSLENCKEDNHSVKSLRFQKIACKIDEDLALLFRAHRITLCLFG